jgi:hypothetical protein
MPADNKMKTIPEPPKHPNQFEHVSNYPRFVGLFVLFASLGAVLGRLIDKSIALIEPTSRAEKAGLFALQVFISATMFFIAFRIIKLDKLFFDDWLSGTFQGIIFVTTFYAMQEELFLNLKGALI